MNKFVSSILSWYKKEKRDLPFRGINDPYKIWLSEVMLQQTKVKTSIPYYQTWIQQYPTLKSVALADRERLLKIWEGLGYYSRCRNFHEATKIILERHNGLVPNNWEEFRSLPGVGEYTASAVLSIAFNKSFPVMDGNVKRVMSRVLGIRHFTKRNLTIIKNSLDKMIPSSCPGDFNQAMMELGAIVCAPKNPKCALCPISHYCKGFLLGSPESYPLLKKKKMIPHYTIVVGLIWRKNKFYIQKRGNKGMLAGLWEFPGGKVKNGESNHEALLREIKEECGVKPKIIKKIGTIKHAYTHFSITFHGYHCIENGQLINAQKYCEWITPEDINNFTFPKANHKIFTILNEQKWHV